MPVLRHKPPSGASRRCSDSLHVARCAVRTNEQSRPTKKSRAATRSTFALRRVSGTPVYSSVAEVRSGLNGKARTAMVLEDPTIGTIVEESRSFAGFARSMWKPLWLIRVGVLRAVVRPRLSAQPRSASKRALVGCLRRASRKRRFAVPAAWRVLRTTGHLRNRSGNMFCGEKPSHDPSTQPRDRTSSWLWPGRHRRDPCAPHSPGSDIRAGSVFSSCLRRSAFCLQLGTSGMEAALRSGREAIGGRTAQSAQRHQARALSLDDRGDQKCAAAGGQEPRLLLCQPLRGPREVPSRRTPLEACAGPEVQEKGPQRALPRRQRPGRAASERRKDRWQASEAARHRLGEDARRSAPCRTHSLGDDLSRGRCLVCEFLD